MPDHVRHRQSRVARGVLLVVGVIGGFVAFDSILLFVFFALSALFIAPTGPYFGLVTFVALPFLALAGAAVAWTAYLVLHESAPDAGSHEVRT